MRIIRFDKSNNPRLGLSLPGTQNPDYLDLTGILLEYLDSKAEETPKLITDIPQLGDAEFFSASRLHEVIEFAKSKNILSKYKIVDTPRLLAPVARPGKIIALGMNYRGHAKEFKREPPSEPIIFAKATTSIVGPDEAVICPQDVGRIDPEAEMAVVIGNEAKRVEIPKALDYVGGYTCLNDMTAREMQANDMSNRSPWFRSKSFDTFCPIGPSIVLTDEVENPDNLDVEMRVNGELRQKANTADLIFNVSFLIHFISRYITLEPGDIISTGTPEGIAPVFPGDAMEVIVGQLGKLKNTVVKE